MDDHQTGSMIMKSFQDSLPFIASLPAWVYIQLMGRTNRFRFEGPDFYTLLKEKKGPYLFALWHSRVMLPIFHFRNKGLAVIVSRSKDGEYITQVMKRFRIHATRGSGSRRGAEGLLGLLHWLKQGNSAVITPDGPRGPRETVQSGVVQLARLSELPVIPVCFSCTRNHRFQSWDRFMLPLPFGTIHMQIGDAIEIPRDLDDAAFDEKRLLIEKEMRRVTELADQRAGVLSLNPDIESDSR